MTGASASTALFRCRSFGHRPDINGSQARIGKNGSRHPGEEGAGIIPPGCRLDRGRRYERIPARQLSAKRQQLSACRRTCRALPR